ncbi:(2Fe-2S)-binding protein [Teredinibacter sp. KSP-S5-2]|uniref:(2Fe-2S)-binding protein n=1 Tax=Teredinibacter sp. KSP-S5-2 TaxID=3034506 RepID=UPI0029342482|nr:2Fe-2S iron-sulfur cluster-binding protein [Teredinibacter sp. KSP-S5-2]WNO08481.1 (2Fe-2S)-binding protein [Teredinibacter sp. KSP-S5-2]
MQKFTLTINNNKVEVSAEPDTPLLWVLRDFAGLKGTKYGCGVGLCGACTVHIDGNPIRSCSYPVVAVGNQKITTIEATDNEVTQALKHAWIEHNVPQCGYCQPGQIMSATALLESNHSPSEKEIEDYMSGNICRCGTYPRIKAAIQNVSTDLFKEA